MPQGNACRCKSASFIKGRASWLRTVDNFDCEYTLQGINISHLGKRKLIFKRECWWDMLVPKRVRTTGSRWSGWLVTFLSIDWQRFLSKRAWIMPYQLKMCYTQNTLTNSDPPTKNTGLKLVHPGRLTAGTYSHHPFRKANDLNQTSIFGFQP